ncbi:hypothetical protein F4679DRAFT_561711 [Xylaria curta]|nr:hypothetical protein F4679DRAFT_561711 [Xylaria curta]
MPRGGTTTGLTTSLSLLFAQLTLALTLRQEAPFSPPEALLHNVQLQRCPQSCEYAGPDPATWTTYHSFDDLALCDDTVLYTLNVQSSTLEPRIKACSTTVGGPRMQAGAFYGLRSNNVTDDPSLEAVAQIVTPMEDQITAASQDVSCGATPVEATVEIETRWSGQEPNGSEDLSTASSQLEKYFRDQAGCGPVVVLARSGDVVVGAFAGGDLARSAAANLVTGIIKIPVSSRYAMQACGSGKADTPALDTRFGLFADLRGNTSFVHTMLGEYVSGLGKCIDLRHLESGEGPVASPVTVLGSSITSDRTESNKRWAPLMSRATCRDIQVQSGDSCASLAQRCGISANDFTKFNSKKADLCSTLMPKQYVCCSAGDLPDHTPQPGSDGSCYTYTVKANDGCWAIGDSFGIDTARIEENNKKTFGFAGCSRLQLGQVICLSKGTPPMPAQDPTALCGPWVVGTKRPSNYDDVGKLNPCPLNACCDIWGQCGTTADFCTRSEVDGHPGTAQPGTNGCVSNCGTDIVNNASPPSQYRRIGYFEGFNPDRICLRMDITQFDVGTFTHIHFAFATITSDFKVSLSGVVKEQFDKMVKMDTKGTKKILSFGGWSFSTDYDTAPIFAHSVSAANRELFASNVVQFLKDHGLDGLDFDWEYPGATDIPGSVPGNPDDGANYLSFLQSVKSKLPSGKTLSIAIPASYWYLRGFPVDKMAKVVDYFIYMTYDLHGQWDYGSKWANPGCASGSCLRSHVNRTETRNALSMVTKAGARADQVVVGVSSYGRSFKMKDSSCTGPTCEFTGSRTVSNAEKGSCTDTAGYISDAELRRLIDGEELEEGGVVRTWFDENSQSDILTWNGNWVAWMNENTKTARIKWAKDLNFGGTSDWAVDLESFRDPVDGDTSGGELIAGSPSDCPLIFNDLDHVMQYATAHLIPSFCRSIYVLGAMGQMLDSVIAEYEDTNNNYDGKFKYYAEYIDDLVNPQLQNWMDNWGTDKETKRGLGNRFFDCKYKRTEKEDYRYQGPCPVPKSIMSDGTWDDPELGYESWIIEYTLRDKEGFEEALLTDLGMSPDWIKWGEWDEYTDCLGCTPCPDCPEETKWHRNYPRKADKITVQDPKEIWEQALPEMGKLKAKFSAAMLAVGLNIYDAKHNDEDAAVALAVPVQLLAQAVRHMADIKEIGSEIEARKKKELILLIVSLVLVVVPFLSEVGFSLAGLTAIARFAFISGEIANGALSLAEVIKDPSSAPFAVMGLLLGAAGRGLKNEEVFSEAATARRLMDDIHVGAMGRTFKEVDDKVQLVLKSCGRF